MFVLKNLTMYTIEVMAYPSYTRLIIMPRETVNISEATYSLYRDGLSSHLTAGNLSLQSPAIAKAEPVEDKEEKLTEVPASPVVNAEEASAIVDKIPETSFKKKMKQRLNS